MCQTPSLPVQPTPRLCWASLALRLAPWLASRVFWSDYSRCNVWNRSSAPNRTVRTPGSVSSWVSSPVPFQSCGWLCPNGTWPRFFDSEGDFEESTVTVGVYGRCQSSQALQSGVGSNCSCRCDSRICSNFDDCQISSSDCSATLPSGNTPRQS